MTRAACLALLVVAAPALAQSNPSAPAPAPLPPPPLPATSGSSSDSTVDEIQARVHYEKALRHEVDGELDQAEDENRLATEAALRAHSAQFIEATARLQDKIVARRAHGDDGGSSGLGARVEFVATTTSVGLWVTSYLVAGMTSSDAIEGRAAAGILTLGGIASLAGSIIGTKGVRVGQSWAQMEGTGAGFGTYSLLMLLATAGTDNLSASKVFYGLMATTAFGALSGVVAARTIPLTGGDAAAISTGLIFGSLVPGLLVWASTDNGQVITGLTLATGTVAMILLGVANRSLNWSRGRWTLIQLGGGVGFLAGLGISAATLNSDSSKGSVLIIMAAGTIAGLALTAWATDGFGPDERRNTTALLDWRPKGGLVLGDLLTAVGPTQTQAKDGSQSLGVVGRVFEARF